MLPCTSRWPMVGDLVRKLSGQLVRLKDVSGNEGACLGSRTHAAYPSEEDMKEILNCWRSQPRTWMDPPSLAKVNAMNKPQDVHKARKSIFKTMLFTLFGSKGLVHTLIHSNSHSSSTVTSTRRVTCSHRVAACGRLAQLGESDVFAQYQRLCRGYLVSNSQSLARQISQIRRSSVRACMNREHATTKPMRR